MMSLESQVNEILNSEQIPSFHVNEESKNTSEQLKNNVTNVTSVTGEGFGDDQSSPDRHFPSSECHFALEIEYGELIEEYKNNNGEIKQKLLIESKAALIFQCKLNGRLAHDPNSQTWHQFTGSQWKPLEKAQEADKHLVSMLYQGAGDLGFKLYYKNGIRSLLTDGHMLPLPKQNSDKLPFRNGFLSLKTKLIEPITPDNAFTWCLPYKYDSKAKCPHIKTWLSQAVDDDVDTVQFLRAWMAAVLHGRSDLQKFLHLKGSGGTGKGVFTRLLTQLVGEENTVETQLDKLEQNRFETARLYNKRLVLITESDKYGSSINNLKAITGQDQIRLERKHQQQFGGFIFGGLVVMSSNESMQTTDHTSGLDRRRITVIFDRRATNEEKQAWDEQGGEKAVLHSEMPGLVNWLLELTQSEISEIIRNPPQRIRQADDEARRATNPIADWINECCEVDPDTWTRIGDKREITQPGFEKTYENAETWLYANYLQWCLRANKSQLAKSSFTDLLKQTCQTLNIEIYSKKRNVGAGFFGLRLKTNQALNMRI